MISVKNSIITDAKGEGRDSKNVIMNKGEIVPRELARKGHEQVQSLNVKNRKVVDPNFMGAKNSEGKQGNIKLIVPGTMKR